MNVLLGGASAETDDNASSSPFGAGSTSLPPTSTALGSTTGNSGSGSALGSSSVPITGNSGIGAVGSVAPTATSAPAAASPSGGSQQALGPMQRTSNCISLGPSGGGCNTGNVAVPIGLLALGLVASLFTWDYLRQRRRLQLNGGTYAPAEGAQ
jgi:hypothetical protein